MLTALKRFKKLFTDTLVSICAALCTVILVINVVNVVVRYLTSASFTYTEDITVISMLWIMGLGVSVGWINREHLLINLIDQFLSPRGMERLLLFQDIVGVAAGVAMIWLGRMSQAANTGFVQSVIGFDESFRYWPVLVGGGLLIVAALECIAERLAEWKEGGAEA